MANSATVTLTIFRNGIELDLGSEMHRCPADDALLTAIRDALVDKLALICPLAEIDNLTTRLRFCTRLRDAIVHPPRTLAPSSRSVVTATDTELYESMEAAFFVEEGVFGLTALRVACTGSYARSLERQWERLKHHGRKAVLTFVHTPKPSKKFLAFVSKMNGVLASTQARGKHSDAERSSMSARSYLGKDNHDPMTGSCTNFASDSIGCRHRRSIDIDCHRRAVFAQLKANDTVVVDATATSSETAWIETGYCPTPAGQ